MKKRYNNIIVAGFLLLFIFSFYLMDDKHSDNRAENIERIVSLSPSITSQIIDLGKGSLIVGVTSYHPPMDKKAEIIGTLVKPNIEKILTLKPDVVLSSETDNPVQNSDNLKKLGIPVITFKKSDSFESICESYLKLAKLLHCTTRGEKKINGYRKSLKELNLSKISKPEILMLISHKPLMGISNESYIGNMIKESGGENILKNLKQPYPIISMEYIVKSNPDIIISIMAMSIKESTLINNIKNNFSYLKVSRKNNFFNMKVSNVCYYTPFHYIESLKEISHIIKSAENRGDKSE